MSSPLTSPEARSEAAKACALQCGFDACGIAEVQCIDPEDRLGAWLESGYHAGMDWLRRTKTMRQDVRTLLRDAQSVVVVAQGYYAPRPKRPDGTAHVADTGGVAATGGGAATGRVARYAWGGDYHRVLLPPLRRLARFIESLEHEAVCLWSIDTKPILEKFWAARAGIGWIGKHSLIMRPGLGSWLVLGLVVTNVRLAPDAPMPNNCGDCHECIGACPTGAIVAPGIIDARRCVAYHTIESATTIPNDVAASMGNWLFGCDACQEACPWNQRPPTIPCDGLMPKPGNDALDLHAILEMDEQTFSDAFRGSAIKRAGLRGLQRTAATLLEHAP